MTTRELARLVEEMRRYQVAFFRGDRSPDTLVWAKALEREVDKAVAAVLSDPMPLFGGRDG